jgi:hypothetical protein
MQRSLPGLDVLEPTNHDAHAVVNFTPPALPLAYSNSDCTSSLKVIPGVPPGPRPAPRCTSVHVLLAFSIVCNEPAGDSKLVGRMVVRRGGSMLSASWIVPP